MAAILSPLGLYGGSGKTKIPLKPKLGYMPTKGTLGICLCSTMGRMPGDRTSLSFDASLATSTHVLRLEASSALRPKPVRPILQTDQAGFGLTATPGLRPRLCGSVE
jgi:hypothetical protein